jgi:restriction endonuclease S subunit
MAKEYRIGDFLRRIKRPVELQDSSIYKRVTIRSYHKGIVLRDELLGSQIGTKNQFIINSGDFLLSKIDARTGAFGVVDKTLNGAIITGNFWAYTVDNSIVDKNWFLEYTSSDEFINVCEQSSTGTTHRKYLDENIFLNHKIILAPIEEQYKIFQKQNNYKDIVNSFSTENQVQTQLLFQLRQSILQETIQGKLTAEWRKRNPNVEPAVKLLKCIKAEKEQLIKEKKIKKEKPLPPITDKEVPFELPEGWAWCRLGDVSQLKSGDQYNYPSSDNGIMFVKVSDMNTIENEFDIKKSSNYFKKETVKENDLICIGSIIFPKRGGAIATNKRRIVLQEPILIDCNTMAIVPSKKINFNYFFHWFATIDLSKLGNEAVIPQVNNKDIFPLCFPLPPLSEQQAIVEKIEILLAKCDQLQAEIENMNRYSKELLRALFNETFGGGN